MVRGFLFKDKRFDAEDENNLMYSITKNTVVLCPDHKLMCFLSEEILNTINGNAEYNDYDCDSDDVGTARYELNFGLQKVININNQRIILCLEPAMIYRATAIKDIWFADWVMRNGKIKISVYPMNIFKGSREVWKRGLGEVYKTIVEGRYGCYNGKWVNLIV